MTQKILALLAAGSLAAIAATETPMQQAELLYREGQAAERAYDPAAAEKAYTSALKVYPNHANARYSLGQIKINGPALAAKGREQKFGAVMIPVYQLDGATLQESLDALAANVEKESNKEVTPNFVLDDPKGELAGKKISLDLKNMPAKGVLKYVLEQVKAKPRYDEHAIVIKPIP